MAFSFVQFAALLGALVSLYAWHVETEAEFAHSNQMEFKALCDLSASISCSKVFTSKYGRVAVYFGLTEKGGLLDVPNAAFGLLFYTFVLVQPYLSFIPYRKQLVAIMATAALSLSVWLGYILAFVLQDLCIVCVSTYVTTSVVFIGSMVDLCSTGKKSKAE